jgi:hypothetical protein
LAAENARLFDAATRAPAPLHTSLPPHVRQRQAQLAAAAAAATSAAATGAACVSFGDRAGLGVLGDGRANSDHSDDHFSMALVGLPPRSPPLPQQPPLPSPSSRASEPFPATRLNVQALAVPAPGPVPGPLRLLTPLSAAATFDDALASAAAYFFLPNDPRDPAVFAHQ